MNFAVVVDSSALESCKGAVRAWRLLNISVVLLAGLWSGLCFSDGKPLVCESVGMSSLNKSAIVWRVSKEQSAIINRCMLKAGSEANRAYYAIMPLKEIHDICGYKSVSLNRNLRNAYGVKEPIELFYFALRNKNECPLFSASQYFHMPPGANESESIGLFMSLVKVLYASTESKSKFDFMFSEIGIFDKLYYGFYDFRDAFFSLIDSDEKPLFIDDVYYCYDNEVGKEIKSCLNVDLGIQGHGMWTIKFNVEASMTPIKVTRYE